MQLPTLDDILAFFFEASLAAGWCNPDADIITSPSGERFVLYNPGVMKYIDRWFVSPATPGPGWSHGQTTIYKENRCVFVMSYEGYYSEYEEKSLATEIVKPALLSAYSHSEFEGGRGPQIFSTQEYPALEYCNRCSYANPIGAERLRHFWGAEKVVHQESGSEVQAQLGYHVYMGSTLGISRN